MHFLCDTLLSLFSETMEKGTIFIKLIILLHFFVKIDAFCSDAKKPIFTGKPKVYQIAIDKVILSWKDIIKNKECADEFIVKYKNNITNCNEYHHEPVLGKSVTELEISVAMNVKYEFEVIVRVIYASFGNAISNEADFTITRFTTSNVIQTLPTTKRTTPSTTTSTTTTITTLSTTNPITQDEDKIQSFVTHTNCSVTCGPGVKSIITMNCKRSCFPECCKRTVEEENCQKPKCTQRYGHWTSWTECNKPCITDINERSVKTRFRICLNCETRQHGNQFSKLT